MELALLLHRVETGVGFLARGAGPVLPITPPLVASGSTVGVEVGVATLVLGAGGATDTAGMDTRALVLGAGVATEAVGLVAPDLVLKTASCLGVRLVSTDSSNRFA